VRKNKDHICTNNIKMPVQPGIILSDLSDHLPTFVLIKSSCLKQKHSSITLRHNYKNLDKSTFLQEIKDALDMLPVNNGNSCQVVDDIHSIFNNTMQKHTPLQTPQQAMDHTSIIQIQQRKKQNLPESSKKWF